MFFMHVSTGVFDNNVSNLMEVNSGFVHIGILEELCVCVCVCVNDGIDDCVLGSSEV